MKLLTSVLFIFIFWFSCSSPVSPGTDNTNRIVFTSRRDTRYQVYTVNPDGSDVRQITFFKKYDAFTPRWSPDKSQIVFASDSLGTTAGTALYIMNADGKNIHPVKWMPGPLGTRLPLEGSYPAWSPEGNTIAYSFCPSCEGGGLSIYTYLIDLNSLAIKQLTDSLNDGYTAYFSSDGKKMVFISMREHQNVKIYHPDLYIMNSDGTDQKKLMSDFDQMSDYPVWSPDGTIIIFSSLGQLYSYSFVTKKATKVQIEIPNHFLFALGWSNNESNLLLYSRSLDGYGQQFLYTLNLNSNEITKVVPDNKIDGGDW